MQRNSSVRLRQATDWNSVATTSNGKAVRGEEMRCDATEQRRYAMIGIATEKRSHEQSSNGIAWHRLATEKQR